MTKMIKGIGVDIIAVKRVEEMMEAHGEVFCSRVFTRRETEYCQRFTRPGERLAGRFAAKEAVLKALGTGWRGGISWQDVEILQTRSGAPEVKLSGAAEAEARKLGVQMVHLSISHSRDYALAFAIAEG
jgi:holo-[acyl-carrier protein] synthase